MAYWNPKTQSWEVLPSMVDGPGRVVSARTTHFSLYQVMRVTVQGATPLAVGEADAFPNPASQTNPTLHIEVGIVDRVEIHVYDISGELVHRASLNGPPQTIDDGLGPQYAYEYTWDVSGIASGIYIYVVTAHKGGQGSAKVTGKVAVLK